MASSAMRPGMYYECRHTCTALRERSREEDRKLYVVKRGKIVFCEGFGREGFGREGFGAKYARIFIEDEYKNPLRLLIQVSENDVPRGVWEEANPMVVLAMADQWSL